MTNHIINKPFVFIMGVEGSGTTLLQNLIDMDSNHKLLGGNVISEGYEAEAYDLGLKFNELWKIGANESQRKKALDGIVSFETKAPDTVVMKRSYPFIDERYMPRIEDLYPIFPDLKVIYIQRGFLNNVNSIIRRGFEPDFTKATNRIADGYKALASDWKSVKDNNVSLLSMNYDSLVNSLTKETEIQKLVEFLSLDRERVPAMLEYIKS